jgi:2-polyprenyl-6-methoxyphenol hydroxylase-like FAD-dependent oxidoreductase
LAKKGYKVAILDRQVSPSFHPRGEIIQPNGLKVLDEIGVLQSLQQKPVYRWDKVHFRNIDGDPLCTIRYQNLPSPFNFALVVLPEVIQKLLMDRATDFSNIDFYWGATFFSLLCEKGRVVGVQVETVEKAMREFHAPLIVGGDGVQSPIRKAMSVPCRIDPYENGYMTAVMETPQNLEADLHFYVGKGVYVAMMPVSRERFYIMYLVPKNRVDGIRKEGVERFKEKILSLNPYVREMLSKPLSALSSLSDFVFMPTFRVRCKRWVADGCALMGDAAHAMNPHVAQGRNSALQDASVLSKVIENCFRCGDFSYSALSDYEKIRRPEVEALQRTAHELTWLWESQFTPLVWARERIFRSIDKNPALHDKILHTVAGVKSEPYHLYDKWRALHLWAPV